MMPIPKELGHLKVDPRGYAIPFFVPIIDGKPEFRFASAPKQKICIEQKICAVCGKKLMDRCYYFITGPIGYANRVCSDAAMHRVCAEYSLMVCPHMYFENADRRDRDDLYKKLNAIATNRNLHAPKPKELRLIYCEKFKTIPHNGGVLIKFFPVKYDSYIYENGKLVKNDRK